MAFNINSKEVSETTLLHLVDPATDEKMYADDKEKEPLTIELYSKGSKQYRNALAAVKRKSVKRNNKVQSLEVDIEDNAEFLATVSKVAVNFDMNGKPIDSYEAFKELYGNPKLFWIRDQVDATIQDTANFLDK